MPAPSTETVPDESARLRVRLETTPSFRRSRAVHGPAVTISRDARIVPRSVSTAKQRDVVGVLEVGQPHDAGLAVRARAVVREVELLESDDVGATSRALGGHGAAHGAQAEDRDVGSSFCHVPFHVYGAGFRFGSDSG